jgi:hypothetical protein
MGAAWTWPISRSTRFTYLIESIGVRYAPELKEDLVLDLVYIGLTIVVFAALWLLVRGVERFER